MSTACGMSPEREYLAIPIPVEGCRSKGCQHTPLGRNHYCEQCRLERSRASKAAYNRRVRFGIDTPKGTRALLAQILAELREIRKALPPTPPTPSGSPADRRQERS